MIRAFAAALALAVTALPAAAERLSLDTLSAYLNGIRSAETGFTQLNADGTISTGTVAIKRPGKVRFDYNPPEQALVQAWANAVYVFDRKVDSQPSTYPLNQTPLSLILARNVDLGRAGMVVGHDYDGTATIVTARDPERPEYGSIEMKFTDDPVELRQWVIRDEAGTPTTVVLNGLRPADLPDRIFRPEQRAED